MLFRSGVAMLGPWSGGSASARDPLTFRIATFNVLGDVHTMPGAHDDGYAPARIRAEWMADVLDQITVCVEAGLSFDNAVLRVANGGTGPLPEELGRTLQDVQLGLSRSAALERLLERTDVNDLRSFVHAFNQAERYGIPVAQILRVQSGEIRLKRRQHAEEAAMKLPVKLVFPTVLCILPALFVVVAGPAAIRVVQAFSQT